MLSALTIAAAIFSLPAGDDTREVVGRLASARAAERAEAEAAVEALGDLAADALKEATESRDLELRHRAAEMLDRLDGRRLARPTMVPLRYEDVPLGEVVAQIGRDAGIDLTLDSSGDPRLRQRKVTLRADAPVTLWAAIDRLGEAAGLKLDPPPLPGMNRREQFMLRGGRAGRRDSGSGWTLSPADDAPAAPRSVSGAFRVEIANLTLDRDRSFVRTAEAPVAPGVSSRFAIGLAVRSEPRVGLASIDAPVILEALDEQGRPLRAEALPVSGRPSPAFGDLPILVPQTVSLTLPEPPGRRIASLKGTIRALVVGRREPPVVIPMKDAQGRSFTNGQDTVTVGSIRPSPDGRSVAVEFTIASLGGEQTVQSLQDARAGLRPPPSARGQVEFLDARGRTCQTIDLGREGMGFGLGGRTAMLVQPQPGLGPPTEARYYPATWTTIEIPFAFRDVPMP